jgi:hypothetical protein
MFSFRRDKMGFFNALILIIIVTSGLISTVLIWAIGGWEEHKTSIRWILGTAWVSCIVMVLVRISVFKYQRDKAERRRAEEERQAGEQPPNA